jgi:hypothetical protein
MLWVDYTRLVVAHVERIKNEQVKHYRLLYSITGANEYLTILNKLLGAYDDFDYGDAYKRVVENNGEQT